jgi:mannose/fructose/N-acetylgalactosamine-specific phosphotransferase system component IIB
MPLLLTRIDDRLIHGQVVVGWGNYLHPDRIILCSDVIATISWQRNLYENAGVLMPHVTISILTETETIDYFRQNNFEKENVILLVESPRDLLNLVDKGAPIRSVNVGGMHFSHGKRQLASYIFVSNDDLDNFKKLKDRNIKLEGQNVPTAEKIDITDLIDLV